MNLESAENKIIVAIFEVSLLCLLTNHAAHSLRTKPFVRRRFRRLLAHLLYYGPRLWHHPPLRKTRISRPTMRRRKK